MMKRVLTLTICILFLFAFGCAKEAATEAAPEATQASAEPAAEIDVTEPEAPAEAPQQSDDLHLFRLDAIVSVDEAGVLTVKGTDITFVPAAEGGIDTDYALHENDTVTKTVAPNVIIEFPMPEMDATVAISGAELDGEFRDYIVAHPGEGVLFSVSYDGDAITALDFFYLP